jgi:hypothetical protein
MGADVSKVEPPAGDLMQPLNPSHVAWESRPFIAFNRGMRTCTDALDSPTRTGTATGLSASLGLRATTATSETSADNGPYGRTR